MTKRELSPSIDGPQLEEIFPSPSRPGILTVILREGTGLSVPDGYIDGEQSKPNLPYAILDYDKSQKQADSCEGTARNPVWVPDSDRFPYGPAQQDEDTGYFHAPNWQFDVCRPAELAIYLYLRDLHTPSSMRSQDSFLGVARIAIDPSRVSGISSQWLDVQHGTGQLRISLEYKDMRDQVLEKADFDDRFLYRLMKKDTRQRYFPRTIPVVQQPQNVNHPFLAPFTLAFQSQEGLKLLSPTINGGHLFHHLQRQQCFNLESARFYAAEILCALEYLHNTRSIYSWLKPRNVILDSFGHVVLCGFGIFKPVVDGDRSSYGMPEYPSPEVLLNQGEFRAADWWTLGIFIYEMLIGLPLFFDENTDEIRRKILGPGPIQVSEMLPPVARDVITRLLEREPGHRLGAKGGASEVKEHPFFAGIDWAMLLQRNHEPPFKPDFGLRHRDFREFTQHPTQEHLQQTYKPLEKHLDFEYLMGTLLKDLEPESNLGLESDDEAALTPESSQEGSVQETDNKGDDGWELVWEEGAPGELYFRHRTTGDKKPIPARADFSSNRTNEAAAAAAAAAARNGGPSTSQKQDALEAALQAGHDHIISQILSFGIDLNVDLFGYKSISPLEWSVDHKKLSLVQLMLDNGADVTVSRVKPLVVRAVATGDRKLVELLLQRSMGRVDLTRALRLAVDRRDCAMAQLLLAHGAQCDFEDEDRPLPEVPLPGVIDCCFDRISWSEWLEEFMPPLVRAVKLGDVGLVRLLLRNGANANIGYFGLYSDLMEKSINFSSGRVIQLAMELGRPETIKLLLAAGADISLAQPVWRVPGHSHWDVSRAVYQETMSKLREVVATAEET